MWSYEECDLCLAFPFLLLAGLARGGRGQYGRAGDVVLLELMSTDTGGADMALFLLDQRTPSRVVRVVRA